MVLKQSPSCSLERPGLAISVSISRGAKCRTLKTAVKQPNKVPSGSRIKCRNPYQAPHSLNPSPLFTEKCFVGSPAQKSALTNSCFSDVSADFRLINCLAVLLELYLDPLGTFFGCLTAVFTNVGHLARRALSTSRDGRRDCNRGPCTT